MKTYTKEDLIEALREIRARGFVPCARVGNHGGIGNTLEDLLGIEENNLPIPNAAEWELKTQRLKTASLTTLFHMEPSPRAMGLVVNQLLPLYGWAHAGAGVAYSAEEKSFRQTIQGVFAYRPKKGYCTKSGRLGAACMRPYTPFYRRRSAHTAARDGVPRCLTIRLRTAFLHHLRRSELPRRCLMGGNDAHWVNVLANTGAILTLLHLFGAICKNPHDTVPVAMPAGFHFSPSVENSIVASRPMIGSCIRTP